MKGVTWNRRDSSAEASCVPYVHVLQTHTHLVSGIEANIVTQLVKYDNEYFLGSICNENVRITLIPVYVENNDYFMISNE